MVLFSKITDEIELHEATMSGIVGGVLVTLLYGTILLKIFGAYSSATNIYDRELDVVLYPYLPQLILTLFALGATIVFWLWKSRIAIALLLGLYIYRLVSSFILSGGMIGWYHIISMFIILLLVTGLRSAIYIRKAKTGINPAEFD